MYVQSIMNLFSVHIMNMKRLNDDFLKKILISGSHMHHGDYFYTLLYSRREFWLSIVNSCQASE